MARHGDRSVDGWGSGPGRWASRLPVAFGLGLAALGACAGAAPAASPPVLDRESSSMVPAAPSANAEEAAKHDAFKAQDAGASDGGPKCPYGALDDPHRGFVRCLAPEERDAGGFRPLRSLLRRRQRTPALPTRPRPRGLRRRWRSAHPSSRTARSVGWRRCFTAPPPISPVASPTNGGLSGAAGSLKVQFLVRARGRAEGVEVASAKGVGAEARFVRAKAAQEQGHRRSHGRSGGRDRRDQLQGRARSNARIGETALSAVERGAESAACKPTRGRAFFGHQPPRRLPSCALARSSPSLS